MLYPTQHFEWYTLHISLVSRVAVYSLDILLSPFGTSLCSMSSSSSYFLTGIEISQEAGQVIWYSHLLKNFLRFVVIHTVKSFGIVSKAEIHVFLELYCFCDDPTDVALWSLVPLPFVNPAWTSGSSWFTYCWSLAWRILSITLLAGEMSAIVW